MSGSKRSSDGTIIVTAKDAGVEVSSSFKGRCEDVIKLINKLTSQAKHLVGEHEIFDESIKAQLAAVVKAGDLRTAERLKIGIVGASDMGKSALMNALTHQKNLSKTDSGIEGCTSATCEVTGSAADQDSPYLVELLFYKKKEMSVMFKEYLDDFCLLHFEDEDAIQRSAEETRKLTNSATTLSQLIKTLKLKIFEDLTDGGIHETIKDHHEARDLDEFRTKMAQECFERICDFPGGPKSTKQRDFQDIGEVITFIHPLGSTDEPDSTLGSLWPLVNRIRVYIKDHVLLQDIILGDAPGISDINQCRVRNSYNYLDRCDYLLVVTSTQARIASDVHVSSILGDYGDRFQGQIAVVVTRSDEPVEKQHLDKLLSKASEIGMESVAEEYREREEKIEALKEKKRHLRWGTMEYYMTRAKIEPLGRKQYELAVQLRNESFKRKFLARKNLDIPVIFVSNRHYWRHVDIHEENDPTLSLQATGIPAMRQMLTTLPMRVVYRRMDEYYNRCVSFAEAIKSIVHRKPPNNPRLMKQVTDDLMNAVKDLSLQTAFRDAAAKHAGNILALEKAKYEDKAKRFFTTIEKLHQCTVGAIIRRNGVFKGVTQIQYNWNQTINNVARTELETAFSGLSQATQQALTGLDHDLATVFKYFANRVLASKADLGIGETELDEVIRTCVNLIKLHLEEFSEEYKKEEKNVKLNATKHRDTNYFTISMIPLYSETKNYAGIGYRNKTIARCKNFVSVDHDDVFQIAFDTMAAALRDMQAEHITKLDRENERDVRFLCSKLTCTMEKGGAFEAAQIAGKQFLTKTTNKASGLARIEKMMGILKTDIDAWAQEKKFVELEGDDDEMPMDEGQDTGTTGSGSIEPVTKVEPDVVMLD